MVFVTRGIGLLQLRVSGGFCHEGYWATAAEG